MPSVLTPELRPGGFDRKLCMALPPRSRYHRVMPDTERWAAVLARDRAAKFFYAVASTGIFCRPSCPAKRPKPDSVRFFDSPAAAREAGYRPCRRCDPLAPEPRASLITDLCRFIEANSFRRITLKELSEFADLSPFHLQRLFRAETGLSPREYHVSLRRRDTKPGEQVRYAVADSPLGRMLVAESKEGICAVSFGDNDEQLTGWLRVTLPYANLVPASLDEAAARVIRSIGPGRCDLPLDIRGTVFQQKVWKALQSIPSGETRTYAELAAMVGQPRAVRAAAHACASNRVAVLIPCHRVVRKSGDLGGYRWGVERKAELLSRESGSGADA